MLTMLEQAPALTALLAAAIVLAVVLAALLLVRRREAREREEMEERILDEQAEMLDRLREAMLESARGAREGQEQSMRLLNQTASAAATAQQLSGLAMDMGTRQDRLRQTLDERLAHDALAVEIVVHVGRVEVGEALLQIGVKQGLNLCVVE